MTRKIAFYGVFAALAIIIAVIERMFPLTLPLPGIKLGLPNVVIVMVLYAFNPRWAISISIIRVVLVAQMFGGWFSAIWALSGAIASFIAMALAKRTGIFGVVGVSVVGGVTHGIAQIGVAAIMVQTPGLFYYSPVLIIAGVITGIIIGYTSGLALKHIKIIQQGRA
ncbi:MAG: Gx transporter family protein [Clostridiales bacterium]|jgi:heptaprenyl diphosphate synthase|nr:Gx transporter family protein [Clostridiales bacterium]